MKPEELERIIREDQQRRLKEFDQILQEATERLRIDLRAVIETSPSGESAIAKMSMRAL